MDDTKINERFDRLESLVEGLAQTCAKEFERIDERFETIDKRFDATDAHLENVEARLEGVETRLISVENKIEGVGRRIDHEADQRSQLARRVEALEIK